MYRVQMKNSACVGCVHLLNFHLEAPFSRYISFLNICTIVPLVRKRFSVNFLALLQKSGSKMKNDLKYSEGLENIAKQV